MKHSLVAVWLIFCCCTLALAQKANSQFDPKKLKVTWELVDNDYEGKPQSLSALTLTNTGQVPLPASGWSLYFNALGSVKPIDKSPVQIEHMNGDLQRLVPTADAKAIPAGGSQRIELIGRGRVSSVSNTPTGLYLVWDQEPNKGLPVQLEVKTPDPAKVDNAGLTKWITAAKVYEQNQAVQDIPVEKLPKVFPTPSEYAETGKAFTLTPAVAIVADNAFKREGELLADYLATVLGKKPAVQTSGKGNGIRLVQKAGMAPEGYELQVTAQGITITASTPAGAFYGTQSLKTLIPPTALAKKQASVAIPGVTVSDSPRFGHRAFMMDVARNFQPKEQVLKTLDLMALYKINVLHFHLNDDEGWRLEIPGLPELTEVGAKRGHTVDNKAHLQPSYGSGPSADNKTGSGHYTRADYIEILKYAKDRHIRVIPEIETPGHARAAIKAMDARYERLLKEGKKEEAQRYLLRDLNDQSVYRSVQNWNDNVIDVSLPSTYAFLEKVVDETLKMYKEANAPIQMIHFGGDEVPPGVWEKSPSVQALLQDNPSVKSTDDLWYYYFGKVNDMLKARNLNLYGWEEIGLRKVRQNGKMTYIPNPDFIGQNFHVDVWNNLTGAEDLAYKMANAGYKVVLTNVTNFYLDLSYQREFAEGGLNWGGYLDVDKPFYFIPYDYYKNVKVDASNEPVDRAIFAGKERLTEAGRANIIGLQAPLWSEMVTSPERFEYMLLPKLLGLAERAWSKDPAWATEADMAKSDELYGQAWTEFVNVLGKRELPRLDHYAGGFRYRIPTPGAIAENGRVIANAQFPGMVIRYTTDGSEPTQKSKVYAGPITAKGTVKLRAFNSTGRAGRTVTVENK